MTHEPTKNIKYDKNHYSQNLAGRYVPKWNTLNLRNPRHYEDHLDVGAGEIQENKDYREGASTIETLNKDIVADDEKYIYHGKSIHRLAFEYYDRNYNKEYKSEMSPQVATIFDGK